MSIYWEERAEKILLSREKETEKYIDKISRIYKSTQNQINLEIQKIYNKYSKNMDLTQEAIKVLLNNKETKEYYNNLLKQINTIKNKDTKKALLNKYNAPAYNYRISRLEALKEDIYVKCKVLADKELEYSTQNYTNTIKNTYSDYQADISNYRTNQVISFSSINNNVLNRVLNEKWLGANYSQRIWLNSDILETNLNNILQKGILSGLSNQQMSKELNDTMQTGTFNATRLMRTETNHFHNQAELQSYIDDGIIYYKYLAILDNRTSEICTELNSKIFKVKDSETGTNYPPMHPFCRSTTIPVFEDELELTDKELEELKIDNKDGIIEKNSINKIFTKLKDTTIDDFNRNSLNLIVADFEKGYYNKEIVDKIKDETEKRIEIRQQLQNYIFDKTDYNKKYPNIVDNNIFEKNENKILYRGITSDSSSSLNKYVENFKQGKIYNRYSAYGSGTYFTSHSSLASQTYANKENAVVIKAKLKEDTRVLKIQKGNSYNKEVEKLVERLKISNTSDITPLNILSQDLGLIASLSGYSVIDMTESNIQAIMLILDRSKLEVLKC